jgi:hypothetical protein
MMSGVPDFEMMIARAAFGDEDAKTYVQREVEAAGDDESVREDMAKRVMNCILEISLATFEFAHNKFPNDPMFVWLAWRDARQKGGEMTEWVMSAMDKWAAGISRLVESPPSRDIAGEVGRVLGFGIQGNGSNPFRRLHDTKQEIRAVAAYRTHVKTGTSHGSAVANAVAEFRTLGDAAATRRLRKAIGKKAPDLSFLYGLFDGRSKPH